MNQDFTVSLGKVPVCLATILDKHLNGSVMVSLAVVKCIMMVHALCSWAHDFSLEE